MSRHTRSTPRTKYDYERIAVAEGDIVYGILCNGSPYHIYRNGSYSNIGERLVFDTEGQAKAYVGRVTKSTARKKQWRTIWNKAFHNMPTRVAYNTYRHWCLLPDKLPIGAFIKGTVGKNPKYRMGDEGVYELHLDKKEYYYGKYAALARVLGYTIKKRTGRIVPGGMSVFSAVSRGSRPKDPEKRQLLIRLANKQTGPRLARNMLRQLGILHRYKKD